MGVGWGEGWLGMVMSLVGGVDGWCGRERESMRPGG